VSFWFAVVFAVQALPDVFPETTDACEGESVILTCCYTHGRTIPEDEHVSWFCQNLVMNDVCSNRGKPVRGVSSRYDISDNGTHTNLTIRNIGYNDTGKYTCRMLYQNYSTGQVVVGNSQSLFHFIRDLLFFLLMTSNLNNFVNIV